MNSICPKMQAPTEMASYLGWVFFAQSWNIMSNYNILLGKNFRVAKYTETKDLTDSKGLVNMPILNFL